MCHTNLNLFYMYRLNVLFASPDKFPPSSACPVFGLDCHSSTTHTHKHTHTDMHFLSFCFWMNVVIRRKRKEPEESEWIWIRIFILCHVIIAWLHSLTEDHSSVKKLLFYMYMEVFKPIFISSSLHMYTLWKHLLRFRISN